MDLMYPRRPVASTPDTLQGRRLSLETFMVRVHMGPLSQETEFTSVEAEKTTQALEVVRIAVAKLALGKAEHFELAEVFVSGGQLCKERRLLPNETPVRIQLLWPRPMAAADIQPSTLDPPSQVTEYRFYLRKKGDRTSSRTGSWVEYAEPNPVDTFLSSFLKQRSGKDYPDLCNLPDLNEVTLMENLKLRFSNGNIYTYVGSILIAVNPFKFFPIYNPKYVNMYQNRRLGDLPPHIFAIADAAYHTMLHEKSDQCIVISGESGSGKTESTNLLLHHLTALSQKGLHGSGVEQTILGAGPVLEAFGNAKTVHNNNSSRFGKFIEVNYKENGMVHGAVVEQYLLEKSRIVSQAHNERNYHVFYYLLAGATEHEKESLCLSDPDDFHYLRQSQCHTLEGVDEAHEFARLKQSMEIVGFSTETQRRVFSVLSAVLHLGNIEFKKKSEIHHDEAVYIKNIESVQVISGLLKVKEETLVEALTMKKTTAGEETVIIPYRMEDALATRDAMAKCLYGALFDWIVLQVNHSLLAKKDHKEHQGNSIGVLDIFGFEDFTKNSFEQFCINYANEHLQYYFNQHIFKFEQEEYQREGIQWKNIEFIDNTGCLDLFAKKPHGLFHLLDEECNFPGATNDTLLTKFHTAHKGNPYYEAPQLRESSFTIQHYAGKVKYQTQDFREKNCDLMRPDIVSVLKNSSLGFVRELVGGDPVAVLNWAILRAFFRSFFAFISAGKRYRKAGGTKLGVLRRQKSAGQFVKLARSGSDSALRKNKSFKPKVKTTKGFRDLKSMKTVAGRSMLSGRGGSKKQPPSVSAQFQISLSQLMATLSQANPFFIRCIKSNSNKAPCEFDDDIILRQLRYTGMLATVMIRQSGYNYRLTFEEFIQHYKLLLPRGLCSSKTDVICFLETLDINHENYQIGKTKVFLREAEKILLDDALHQALMQRIVRIQRWMRTILKRKAFLRLREATLRIQAQFRCYIAQRQLQAQLFAVRDIQKWYRMSRERRKYLQLKQRTIHLQAKCRGYLVRRTLQGLREEKRRQAERALQRHHLGQHHEHDQHSSTSDEGILSAKGSSNEELDKEFDQADQGQESEGSSGYPEDSEPESTGEVHSVPSTPTSPTAIPFDPGALGRKAISPGSRIRRVKPAYQEQTKDNQETFTSIESQHTPLSPSALSDIEKVLEKKLEEGDTLTSEHKSPLKKAKHKIFNIMGGKKSHKKEDDSDLSEPEDTSGSRRSAHPSVLGVHVLPTNRPSDQLSAPSPKSSPKLGVKTKKAWSSNESSELPEHSEEGKIKKKRNSKRRKREKEKENKEKGGSGKWNVSGTSAWQYPPDLTVNSVEELQRMSKFMFNKIAELNKDCGRRDTVLDKVFKDSLSEFHRNLISILSVKMQEDKTSVKYKELMSNFRQILINGAKQEGQDEDMFPATIFINAFRGFLDEFQKERPKMKVEEKWEVKPWRKKRKEKDPVFEYLGHKFTTVQFNIPTFCEVCGRMMWMMEKGTYCQICKFTCHKKCGVKYRTPCKGQHGDRSIEEEVSGIFGVQLCHLLQRGVKVPPVIERLITAIEMKGLYTEGVYRKSGAAVKTKQLVKAINADPEGIDFDNYQIHVLTYGLKQFLRELPEPLLTFELYDDFLQATDSHDDKDCTQALYAVIERLPKHNFDLFERLIFHLARVAFHEESNKMSVNSLAIIFAPCVLKTNKQMPAQESLSHVPKQTQCIDYILQEQLQKLKNSLKDIATLENARASADERLSVLRASMRTKSKGSVSGEATIESKIEREMKMEEKSLSEQIWSLEKEKQVLTSSLPYLEPRLSSDDELLESGDDLESATDSMDDLDEAMNSEEYAVTFDQPVSPSYRLRHIVKQRPSGPNKRLPSRYRSLSIDYAKMRTGKRERLRKISVDNYFTFKQQPLKLKHGGHEDEIMV